MDDFLDPLAISSEKSTNMLIKGTFEIKGQFMWGSNYTFLAILDHAGESIQAIYKPIKGERRLWDFPPETLAMREKAAFILSEMLGWNFVPLTTIRDDGPFGGGMLQLYIPHDPQITYFSLSDEEKQTLKPAAVFDIIINNADRKGSIRV